MKKLLLVLVLASLANAAPMFSAVGSAPYEITITFTDPTPQLACDVYISYAPLLAYGIVPTDAVLTGIGAGIAALNLDAENQVYALSLGNTANWANGTQLAKLDLNGVAPNIGTIPVALDVYNGDGASVGQVSVLIPEPATMVILGLGGLLLRRK